MDWPEPWVRWLADEIALDRWRERIDGVVGLAVERLADLLYVHGVAIIGATGRGEPWPLSDVDVLVVADEVDGHRPSHAIRPVEAELNAKLHSQCIPNEVEAALWTIMPHHVTAALEASEEGYARLHDRWPWLGFPLKAQGECPV